MFVVMAGGFSPPPVAVAAGCSILDLHVTRTETVLDRWHNAIGTLDRAGVIRERMCICGGSAPLPTRSTGLLRTLVDQHDYRGPAGALRDACESFPPECTVIAAEAARCCTSDLGALLSHHAKSGADATVARNPDRSPSGLYALSRPVLDQVPHAGFMDLKEQLLSKLLEDDRHIAVCDLPSHGALRLRSRADFLRAVAALAESDQTERATGIEPRVLEGTMCEASVICEGADVAPDAIIVDSVVSPGAAVGAGALVARSIIGPGAAVGAGAEVIDAVVGVTGVTLDDDITGEASR